MTTIALAALVLTFPLAAYCALRDDTGLAVVRLQLQALRERMEAWQAAHDHEVGNLDRRMADVEKAAARAEEETRIVSIQLAELCDKVTTAHKHWSASVDRAAPRPDVS